MAKPQPKKKRGRGRPRLELDPEKIRMLAAVHCTHEEIAATLGCSADTITRNFADAIREGKDQGKASLRRMQWKRAQAGSDRMLEWLGKQILGQKDKRENEVYGKDGGPVSVDWLRRAWDEAKAGE